MFPLLHKDNFSSALFTRVLGLSLFCCRPLRLSLPRVCVCVLWCAVWLLCMCLFCVRLCAAFVPTRSSLQNNVMTCRYDTPWWLGNSKRWLCSYCKCKRQEQTGTVSWQLWPSRTSFRYTYLQAISCWCKVEAFYNDGTFIWNLLWTNDTKTCNSDILFLFLPPVVSRPCALFSLFSYFYPPTSLPARHSSFAVCMVNCLCFPSRVVCQSWVFDNRWDRRLFWTICLPTDG